jgi:phosphoserine phosphatase RsbU/P
MADSPDWRQQVQELMLLQRIAQGIGALLDLQTLLEKIVVDVADTFGYTRSAILLKQGEEMVIAAVRGWTANVHRKGERFTVGRYGIIGYTAAAGQTYYAPDVRKDPYYEISEPLTRSELSIPLKARGELIGIFDVQTPESDGFTLARRHVLEALAVHIAIAIDNARLLDQERGEKMRMLKELEEAQTIQRGLFPNEAPALPPFALSGMCLASRAVGGDWYDYIPLRDGRLAVVLGDVSGKGMAAALLMSSTRSIVRLLAEQEISPSAVLTKLNRILLTDFPSSKFVTMIYALLNPRDGTVTVANAGHNLPLFLSDGNFRFIENPSGPPLGIRPDTFSEESVMAKSGARLVLYSDGISEAAGSDSQEYGATGIQMHLQLANSSVTSLLSDVHRFTAGHPLEDDATIVLIDSVS